MGANREVVRCVGSDVTALSLLGDLAEIGYAQSTSARPRSAILLSSLERQTSSKSKPSSIDSERGIAWSTPARSIWDSGCGVSSGSARHAPSRAARSRVWRCSPAVGVDLRSDRADLD